MMVARAAGFSIQQLTDALLRLEKLADRLFFCYFGIDFSGNDDTIVIIRLTVKMQTVNVRHYFYNIFK
jgi:hypothetical protein